MASPPELRVTTSVSDAAYDAVVLIFTPPELAAAESLLRHFPAEARQAVENLQQKDNAAKSGVSFLTTDSIPAGRLVVSPSGPLNRDEDDVRRLSDAALAGVKRALDSGARKPLLVAPTRLLLPGFEDALLSSTLGALHATYMPLEVREAKAKFGSEGTKEMTKADLLGIFVEKDAEMWRNGVVELARAIESGRIVARDIGGSDPERMAAPRVAEYVANIFADEKTKVKVKIISDRAEFERSYPCYAAVDRSAAKVPRHAGRVIWLEYEGSGPIESTLFLVGKGITYDTGGADIKAGGVMAGMHRDKCGAATVAGFFKTLDIVRPKNIKVVGGLAMCRNSVGSECYVADELITSRAGVRLRVGNTDAEGRMAMVDLLCHAKEMALSAVNPHLMTIATLTGHAIIAMGPAYTIVMENGPAKKKAMARNIQTVGDTVADPFEISTIRREDYKFNKGPSEYEDILQCNNAPSTRTPRGHQIPASFMIVTSGLDKHGVDSAAPLPYCHLDIAGSSGPFPGIPTGAPIPTMTKYFLGL